MRVPVETLRREVDAAGVEPVELARLLGWRKSPNAGQHGEWDAKRVRRTLGLLRHSKGHGYGDDPRSSVNPRTAAAIRAALRRKGSS